VRHLFHTNCVWKIRVQSSYRRLIPWLYWSPVSYSGVANLYLWMSAAIHPAL
jgi:hypothetical protein